MQITAIAVVMLFGCSTTKNSKKTTDALNSWIGHPQTELIEKWGAPTQVFDNGAAGKILVYDKKRVQYQVIDTQDYTKSYQFHVNPEGKIFKWATAVK